jgi:hypothetical protein
MTQINQPGIPADSGWKESFSPEPAMETGKRIGLKP